MKPEKAHGRRKNMLIKRLYPLTQEDGGAPAGGAAPAPQKNDNGEGGEPKSGGSDPEPKKEPEKKYSDEDVNRIIDEKFAKWEAKKKKEAEEAAKLAEMNAEEKANHAKEQAEARAKEAEAKLASYQMAGQARAMLKEQEITVGEDLLSMLVTTEAETTKKNVDAFAAAFKAAVEAEVKERLAGSTPKSGTPSPGLTREEIDKIQDPVERRKKIAENIELYK